MKRQRLSSDQARLRILNAAQKCLMEQGINGLRITNVASEASIVHSSVLHHFGSAEGLKQELAKHLSRELIDEMTTALQSASNSEASIDILGHLFYALGPGGHANLIAWLVVCEPQYKNHLTHAQEEFAPQFLQLVDLVHAILCKIRNEVVEKDEARFIIYHMLSAAIGQGMIGDSLGKTLGMSNKKEEFLKWVKERITRTSPA